MAWPPTTHQDVQDDLTNGHGWATSLAGRFKVGETMLASPIIVSGRYYGASAYSTSSNLAVASGRLYFAPFYLAASTTFDRITINCATLATGTTGRCGVYSADPNTLLPSTLLADGGAISGATTGLKETTISVTLSGLNYFAFVADGATWTSVTASMIPNIFGSGTGSLAGSACGITTDLGTGVTTLPATATGLGYAANLATGMLRAV